MIIIKSYITRLAPSPTGALHLGNARTFLITWLRARKLGGRVLMRMEDLDHPRVKKGSVQQVYDDLHWLGIDWDGEAMVQSERSDLYKREYERLKDSGRLYPCFCTRKDIIAAQSAPNLGDDLVYPNICRPDENGADFDNDLDCAVRFAVGDSAEISYVDNFMGIQSADLARSSGDFIVAREDEGGDIRISYQLACVIDDHYTGVTEVVRADDLVNSTFRQIELYEALGFDVPDFLHLPLVVGEDGRRLAKRHGDSRISCLREKGVNPGKVLGWLGWSCGLCDKHEEIGIGTLLELFDLERISHKEFIVNSEDLRYLGFF